MKKIVKVICLALSVVTILSACSTIQKQSETAQKTEKSATNEFKKPVGIYEHFKTAKNELWYRVSEVDIKPPTPEPVDDIDTGTKKSKNKKKD